MFPQHSVLALPGLNSFLSTVVTSGTVPVSIEEPNTAEVAQKLDQHQAETTYCTGCTTIEITDRAMEERARALATVLASVGYWSMFDGSGFVRASSSSSSFTNLRELELVAFYGKVGVPLYEVSTMRVVVADTTSPQGNQGNRGTSFTHVFHTTQNSLADGAYQFGVQFSKTGDAVPSPAHHLPCSMYHQPVDDVNTQIKYVTYHYHKLARANQSINPLLRGLAMTPEDILRNNQNSTARFKARCEAYVRYGTNEFFVKEIQKDGSTVTKCYTNNTEVGRQEGIQYVVGSESEGMIFSRSCMDRLQKELSGR